MGPELAIVRKNLRSEKDAPNFARVTTRRGGGEERVEGPGNGHDQHRHRRIGQRREWFLIVQEPTPLYLCFRVQNFCWYFYV